MEDLEGQQQAEVNLVVSENMRSYIYDITKWAKFLSIVGIVVSIFIFMVAFSIPTLMNSNPKVAAQMSQLGSAGTNIITVIYLITSLLLFYPSLLLNKIASKAKKAVLFGDQESLEDSFSNLKSLFKYWGILTIMIIAFYFLMIFMVGAGIAAA
ncbi:DUF5362 family protein [Pedobacter sp. Leaf170]|uniref:DUF5362 family protein n=1 Tax=Pedobacter sp. Leaf170 TaxID=2876558 RepID=UPI001E556D3B|nr:DUF5362 family protein [Pedobacter sp. Leaf170]